MSLENIGAILAIVIAFIGAFLAAFWVSLVIWTFRDIRSRSRDIFAQLLASLLVLIFGPLGLGLYLILRPRETLAEAYERSLEEEALLQDIEDRQVCPGCKHPIEPDFMVCPYCHTKLRKPCPHCGRLLHLRWTVCPYCGNSVSSPTPAVSVTAPVEAEEWEAVERPAPLPEAGPGSAVPAGSPEKLLAEDEESEPATGIRRTGRLTFGPFKTTLPAEEPEDRE